MVAEQKDILNKRYCAPVDLLSPIWIYLVAPNQSTGLAIGKHSSDSSIVYTSTHEEPVENPFRVVSTCDNDIVWFRIRRNPELDKNSVDKLKLLRSRSFKSMLSDPTSIHIDGRSESVIIKNFPALKSRELLEGNRTDVAVSIEGFSPPQAPLDGISEDVCQSNGPNIRIFNGQCMCVQCRSEN